MKQLESIKEFDGWLNRYQHKSSTCQCDMVFSVYLPKKAQSQKVPAVYWLSGLTCTDDNVRTKASAQRYAAELGIALVMPDTSPRGENIADDKSRYDLGQGASFYVNATQSPWNKNYHMYDYIVHELPSLLENQLPILAGVKSISGHSMGGHGALICAMKEKGAYRSVSAFAPICHPSICSWGEGCFGNYLGNSPADRTMWLSYDATELIKADASKIPLLIDQGDADEFLADQLYPQHLIDACREKDVPLTFRMQKGYDHSYHFIATFIGEHLAYHAKALQS